MASGSQKVKTPSGWNATQGAWVKTGPSTWKAVDQIYIKAPGGWNNASGQEATQQPYPYIAQGGSPYIANAQNPYPYIANAQEPNIRDAQQPYPYIANARAPSTYQHRSPFTYRNPVSAQEPNIRNGQQPYPYIANAQEPNIRNAQQPYPYIANAQEPNIRNRQNPFTYDHRSPFTYDHPSPFTYDYRSPFTYQAPARQPVTYSYRSPFTYRNPVSAQEPNIRNGQTPFTYPANIQQPNIRSAQHPFTYHARQPGSARQPVPFSYQSPYIGQARQPVYYPGGGSPGLPSGGFGCFAMGTMIWMGDNTYRPIESIEIGMSVMTLGETLEVGVVEEIMQPRVCELYDIEVNGKITGVTGGHPMLVQDKGWCVINMEDWEKEVAMGAAWGGEISGLIEEGDMLVDSLSLILNNQSTAKISNINKLEGEHEVYHLTRVSDNANFFANDFVVHNMNKR